VSQEEVANGGDHQPTPKTPQTLALYYRLDGTLLV
jgi:hypothetical protein